MWDQVFWLFSHWNTPYVCFLINVLQILSYRFIQFNIHPIPCWLTNEFMGRAVQNINYKLCLASNYFVLSAVVLPVHESGIALPACCSSGAMGRVSLGLFPQNVFEWKSGLSLCQGRHQVHSWPCALWNKFSRLCLSFFLLYRFPDKDQKDCWCSLLWFIENGWFEEGWKNELERKYLLSHLK